VQIKDAVALIRDAVAGRDGEWADLGAGGGTFTRALAELLGPESRIYAVDRDAAAVAAVKGWADTDAPNVTVMQGDLTGTLELPPLDGILLANALHFVKDQTGVLARLVAMLKPAGRVVVVEYDRREASRWVPHPVSIAGFQALAASAGLTKPRVVESRPSNYEGIIYAAYADRIPV
jgi:trans-aconitate methyltransferase